MKKKLENIELAIVSEDVVEPIVSEDVLEEIEDNYKPRFVYSTEDVIDRKDFKLIVSTDGIQLTDYIDNPIVLWNHSTDNVIGISEDLVKENSQLIGSVKFASDDYSKDIQTKVKDNIVKKCSIGLDVVSYEDVTTANDLVPVFKITNSIMREISIVPLPANKKATKINSQSLSSNNVDILLYKDNKQITKETFMQTDSVAIKLESNDVTINFEAKCIELETLNLSLTDSITELNKSIENSNLINEDLKAKIAKLEVELSQKTEEVVTIKKENELKEINLYLDNAIAEGKITPDSKEEFMKIEFSVIKSLVEKLPIKSIKLSDVIESKVINNNGKNYEYYTRPENKVELNHLISTNFSLYKRLEEEYSKQYLKK